MTPRKDNYKAKWLASLNANQKTPHEVSNTHEKNLVAVENVQITTGLELSALKEVLVEVAANARTTCEVMDECKDVGMLTFKPVLHHIDGKLSTVPAKVLARRVRDVMRLAEERIGILSAVCEEQAKTINEMYHHSVVHEISHRKARQAVLSTLVLGSNPTSNEIEDFMEKGIRTSGLGEYDDLPDEYSTLLTFSRPNTPPKESASDSDLDDYTALTGNTDNSLSITRKVSRPPLKNHKRNDSRIEDVPI